jgi:hypothetical protein
MAEHQPSLKILVKGYFVTVIASVSQRLPWRPPRHAVPQAREAILPLKTKRLLRQKAPRNDCNFIPKRV